MGSNFSKIIDVFPPHHCINTPDCSRPAVLQNCFYRGAHTHWWSVNQVRLITVLYSLNSNEISKEGFSLSVGLINNISVISHVFFTTSYVRMLFSYNYVLTHNTVEWKEFALSFLHNWNSKIIQSKCGAVSLGALSTNPKIKIKQSKWRKPITTQRGAQSDEGHEHAAVCVPYCVFFNARCTCVFKLVKICSSFLPLYLHLFFLSLRMLYFQGHLGVEPYGTLIISAAM